MVQGLRTPPSARHSPAVTFPATLQTNHDTRNSDGEPFSQLQQESKHISTSSAAVLDLLGAVPRQSWGELRRKAPSSTSREILNFQHENMATRASRVENGDHALKKPSAARQELGLNSSRSQFSEVDRTEQTHFFIESEELESAISKPDLRVQNVSQAPARTPRTLVASELSRKSK